MVLFTLGRGFLVLSTQTALAGPTPQFPSQTVNGSIGLQGTISADPPKTGATIATPGNGASFTDVLYNRFRPVFV